MNAANLCPSPRVVSDRVTELTRDIDRDCSSQNRAKFAKLLEQSRGKVAAQLGVSADEIALVRNTSEANNTINNGLPLKAGDEVVLWDQNHPTNNVAWDVRAARFGLAIKRVSTPKAPAGADQLVEVFLRAFNGAHVRVSPHARVQRQRSAPASTGTLRGRPPARHLCPRGWGADLGSAAPGPARAGVRLLQRQRAQVVHGAQRSWNPVRPAGPHTRGLAQYGCSGLGRGCRPLTWPARAIRVARPA